jgi:hypothetical protein
VTRDQMRKARERQRDRKFSTKCDICLEGQNEDGVPTYLWCSTWRSRASPDCVAALDLPLIDPRSVFQLHIDEWPAEAHFRQ